MAAILKIQNGGRYSSQITCLHFLYDSNNKKLSIHKISCFYDNLNNLATNRSTTPEMPFYSKFKKILKYVVPVGKCKIGDGI